MIKKKIFELNLKERYILFFKEPSDIALRKINDLIELCNHIKFLIVDLNYKNGFNFYLNNKIFILGYPLGNTLECSSGKIRNISDNEFEHDCCSDFGSSGSPIILNNQNISVIGIHKGGNTKKISILVLNTAMTEFKKSLIKPQTTN